ncbi:condensation domain-containing protein [Nocardia harenae]|uniref:condensation domain-containing protein n=1 Tax=Nocardia harenae TaxID=358707 RepID=UPI00083457F3|nr:condensation domain-containing protein [Nocardia harenae]
MEFTELADYPLPAGTLTEWVPVTPGDPWRPDDRPLSWIHEEHCARRQADSGPGSWLGTIFEIPDRYDEPALRETLRRWIARHETFHTTVRPGGADDPRWNRLSCRADEIDVEPRLVGALRTGTRVYQHITDFFEARLAPTRWPHCLLATVTDPLPARAGDGFLLVFGADHSVMDAYSMMLAISEIQRLYREVRTGEPAVLPEVSSCVDYGGVERGYGDELTTAHPAVRGWQEFLGRCGDRFPGFPLDIVSPRRPTPGRHQSGLSAWSLTAERAAAFEQRCRAAGHSVQTGVLATVAEATRTLAGTDTLDFAMPMHTRQQPGDVHAMGWYVGLAPVRIESEGADGFDAVMDRTAAAVRAARPLARYPYPRVAHLLGNASVPRFVVSYLDVRAVPDSAEWRRWAVRPLRSGETSDDEVYFWIARSPDGLAISARFPSNEVAAANVHRFINAVSQLLGAVATTGELPVSALAVHG